MIGLRSPRNLVTISVVVALLLLSGGLAHLGKPWLSLVPSGAALLVVFITHSALIGLLVGATCGALLVTKGAPLAAAEQLALQQFWPIFSSSWKLSAILFTLILGGFVALVEAGGGLQGLVKRLLGSGRAPHKRMQLTVFGFGLLVFFDGLANTMLIGRLLRTAADRCGVSRQKLAYLADTTGSAVACLAFISTWIAFQLSMIHEGFALVGREVSAYTYFFKSLPFNYYCWFALLLALVSILREFNPGSMAKAEHLARTMPRPEAETSPIHANHWGLAIVPILVLTFSIPLLTYVIGAESLLPFSLSKFAQAYGRAETYVPQILVAASALATLVAAAALMRAAKTGAHSSAGTVFLSGVREIAKPTVVLIAAWMLGAAISQLGTADHLSALLEGRISAEFLPAMIFLFGAVISFSTGTSWGTMGVLMPLAIPVIFAMTGESSDAERDRTVAATIGAVFSGAVFGDHCSPFSDTTIVASIASGVEPLDHVRTQMPFALIAALIALVLGFLPTGFGLPAWAALALGGACLGLLPTVSRKCDQTCPRD